MLNLKPHVVIRLLEDRVLSTTRMPPAAGGGLCNISRYGLLAKVFDYLNGRIHAQSFVVANLETGRLAAVEYALRVISLEHVSPILRCGRSSGVLMAHPYLRVTILFQRQLSSLTS